MRIWEQTSLFYTQTPTAANQNMKKTALYILLFAYSTAMLKPVTPYISDAVAHIFYKARHMATVHYEDGKFHVHKEVVKNEKENESAKEKPSSKKDNSNNDQFCSSKNDEQQRSFSGNNYRFFLTATLPFTDPRQDYPPPKV